MNAMWRSSPKHQSAIIEARRGRDQKRMVAVLEMTLHHYVDLLSKKKQN
jgi:hypothetical protein